MASGTEFSRQVSQRLHLPTAALTEANLYRHTITSPPTRDAKLKHILAYVEMQQELVALEEETHRNAAGKGRWRNTFSTHNPTRSDLTLELHSSQQVPPHHRHQQQEHPEEQPQHKQQFRLQDPPALAQKRSKQNARERTPPLPPSLPLPPPPAPAPVSASAPTLYQPLRHHGKSPHHINYVPDGLDPSMALPRALPRSRIHQGNPLYDDPFYSGIGPDSDWRQLEELDPKILARIHLHGDPCDLQQQPSSFPAPSSLVDKYPTNEFSPALKQQNIHRQLQFPNNDDDDDDDDDDEFGVKVATRNHRQHPISQAQHYQQQYQKQQQDQEQQQPYTRQLASPTLTFVEKEKKGRLSSRFSFLTRGRKGQHQRHESVPNTTKEIWSPDLNGGHARVYSLAARPGSQAMAAFGSEREQGPGDAVQPRSATPTSKRKSNSRMKQMLKDVFSMSSRRRQSRSPETPFRDISLPSTHIRTTQTPSPQLHHHQQHLDPNLDSQLPYSAAPGQRKGLVTPTSRPGTSQSFYFSDNNHNNHNNHISYGKGTRNTCESLVDPILPQNLAFQTTGRSDEDDLQLADVDQNSILWSPYVQTSLTPPPVSPLRQSTSSHRVFGHGSREYDPVFISAATTANELLMDVGTIGGGGARTKTRPSSQLMPIPKDLVDSGCDSMGGHEHCATASNTTTLNNIQSNALGHQPSPNQAQSQHQHPAVSSYGHVREMTVTTYEKGPTILSMAQVHKVDLEGLGQNHQHHSPPHVCHLSMVADEYPYA